MLTQSELPGQIAAFRIDENSKDFGNEITYVGPSKRHPVEQHPNICPYNFEPTWHHPKMFENFYKSSLIRAYVIPMMALPDPCLVNHADSATYVHIHKVKQL